ncbi:hypothetical protein F4818DRAFT_437525 [Hypoxylon cercidicola]|nr:hypothetical protein F4818DRAFT_437525 [Hypoxylon cercidicola]
MASARPTAGQREVFGDRLSELTTVFTPPCPITWLLTTTKVPSQYPAFPTTGPVSCDPPQWALNLAEKGFAYYSPAICPSGFTAGCTISNEPTGEGFPPITAGETAMYCIPSGFTCTSDTTDFRGGVWGFLRTTSAKGGSVTVGPAIQIRWQEKDLIDLATDPLTPELPIRTLSFAVPTVDTTTSPEISSTTSSPLTTSSLAPERSTTPLPIPVLVPSTTISPISTTTEVPASASSFSTIPPSATTSTQLEGPPASENGDNTSSSKAGQVAANVASTTSVAAMALSGILIFMILSFLAVGAIRRYRRYRAGEMETYFPFRLGTFVNQIVGKRRSRPPSCIAAGHSPKNPDAELDTDGPIPELGPGIPLGAKENPAELVGSGVRNSWMSQVSRMFTVKKRKDVWSV